jgi:nitric oxide reductase NorD protein
MASGGSRCGFDAASAFLQHFVIGLGGRQLSIAPLGMAPRDQAYTDTASIFLPECVEEFPGYDANFTLYKLTAAHLWAQTRYGTWRQDAVAALSPWASAPRVMAVFNALECLRLDACIARDLPGLARQMDALAYRSEDHRRQWQALAAELGVLARPGATALDSIGLLESCFDKGLPAAKRYQGGMDLIAVNQALKVRVEREKIAVQQALGALERALRQTIKSTDKAISTDPQDRFTLLEEPGENANLDLYYDGELIELTPEIQVLLESIRQDLGEVPRQYLDGVAGLPYASDLDADLGEEGLVADGADIGPGVIRYREWDYVRQRFREDYCLMRESEVVPVADDFVAQTLEKYQGLLKAIQRTFAAVRSEPRLLRRQSQGDDIDIDALVEAQTDFVNGQEFSEYLYTRYRNRERSIAVLFMVDMSGSTHGWINDAERESLILLCEALETLGDRYAIYGFSGKTNLRCETYRVKRFDEAYTPLVRQRIGGIRAKGFTRMGVAIRHLGRVLEKTRARTKILITLSDGRPEDYDAYRGRYAVEDTRHALLELRQQGVHPFCITIDREAQEYLPHLYGAANYTVVHEVRKLPLKVADIYRRLTAQ